MNEAHQPGLSIDERKEPVELRRKNRPLERAIEILNRTNALHSAPDRERRPKWAPARLGASLQCSECSEKVNRG